MKNADIVIVGSGSLAAKVVLGLAQSPKKSVRVAVVGRSVGKVSRLVEIANAKAAALSSSVSFVALELQQFRAAGFSRLLRSLKPKVIFQTASLQSPWESAVGANGWTKLVKTAGFGVTLPLQMALTAEVSRAAGDSTAAIVNACYPDCVNVALEQVGLRVTCGIGNAGIVEAFCRAQAKREGAEVRVVGHHGHLAGWLLGNGSAPQPRIWVKGREVEGARLSPRLDAISEDLNEVTAATSLAVIVALLTGETLRLSIPGVAGLPGGYPYEVRKRKFAVRLPAGITREQAMAHNRSGERLDGLELDSGVGFTEQARQALAEADFPYAQGFAFAEWEQARDAVVELSNRLRATV